MYTLKQLHRLIRRSFILKLNLGVWGIVLMCFVAIALVLGIQSIQRQKEVQREHGFMAVSRAASRLDKAMAQVENIAAINAFYIEAVDNLEQRYNLMRSTVFQTAETFLNEDPCITGIGIALKPGLGEPLGYSKYAMFYWSSLSGKEISREMPEDVYTQSQWYLRAEQEEKAFWVHPDTFPEVSDAGSTVLHVVPLRDKKTGVFFGCLFVELGLKNVREVLSGIQLNGDGFCFMYEQNGNFVMHPVSELERRGNFFQRIERMNLSESKAREAEEQLRQGKPYSFHLPESPVYEHGEYLFVVPCDNGWMMGFAVSGDNIWEQTKHLLMFVGVFCLMTGSTVCLLVYFFTRKYSQSLIELTKAVKEIADGNFTVPIPEYREKDEIGLLTKTFSNMRMAMLSYLHDQELNFIARQDYQTDLSTAKKIQMSILPKLTHEYTDNGTFRIGTALITAKGVGGDLYDFFMLDDRHLALIIGDVCGKGIPAALFMAVTETLQRGIAHSTHGVDKMVSSLNSILCANNDANMFVTYFCAVVDIKTGCATYCNAGHNLPMLRRASGDLIEVPGQNGLPLGIFPQTYSYSEIVLEEGDTLILYTDGVTEAFNPDDELFGEIRLKQAIACAMNPEPAFIIDTISKHMQEFVREREQSDDITLLAMTRLVRS